MTFGQLQTAVYQVCGYAPPVQPMVVARVKNWINEAHRHCLRQPGLVELRQRSGIPFTSVAGQSVYAFPNAFERVDAVVERTTQRRLRQVSRDVFRSIDPAETSQGTPTCYAPEGWQCRFALPIGPPRTFPATPGAPTVADTGVGAYARYARTYRIGWLQSRFNTDPFPTVPHEQVSPLGPGVAFTPSGTGLAARITRPALAGQGETHWLVTASTDGVHDYIIAGLPSATTFWDDVLPTAQYGGVYGLWNFPSSAIFVESQSPADTTQTVRLNGIRSTGDLHGAVSGPLTGNQRVRIDPNIVDYCDLVSLTLSSVCVGDVSFYDSGGKLLARIPAGQTSSQYWCLRLWPTPSGTVTYYVDGQIEIPDLIYETDVPLLPPSFHDLLAAFARMREYERTGDPRLAVAASEWERGIVQLRASVNFPDDWKPVAGSLDSVNRGSNLGGYFPADWTWP